MTSRNTALTETLIGYQPKATHETLEQLWAKAESFGYVGIYCSKRDARETSYCATIYFSTVEGTQLEAASKFSLPLTEALRQAIAKAEIIKGQFK